MALDVLRGGPEEREEGAEMENTGMDTAPVFSDKCTQEGNMFTRL